MSEVGGAEHRPVAIDAGPVAVLVSHGFTGSPYSVRPWAEALAAAGYTVRVPLLPGHGTTWQQMARTRWQAWYDHLEAEFDALAVRHERVFVAGLSMGGALALRLAEHRPRVAGLLLVNPAVASLNPLFHTLPVLSRVLPSLPAIGGDIARRGARGEAVSEHAYPRTPLRSAAQMVALWRDTRARLEDVTQPLLYFRSRVDHVVDGASLPAICEGVASADVTVRILPSSYHVATLDYDAPMINAESAAWIASHA